MTQHSATVVELSGRLNEQLFVEPPPEPKDPYVAIAAMNWSTLKHMYTSPKECQHRMATPSRDTAHFVFGRAAHMAVLEPEKFDSCFGVYDGVHDKRHKAFQAWFAENPGKKPLKQQQMDLARAVADAVFSHPEARALIGGGRREEIIRWEDEETGMACKARMDYVRPDMILELKSTKDIEQQWFTRDAAKYLYHGQVAFYHDGATRARAISASAKLPPIIAVEKEPPHDTAVIWVPPDTIEIGRGLYRHLLNKYLECTAADWWPGKAPTAWYLDLPPWAPGMEL